MITNFFLLTLKDAQIENETLSANKTSNDII